MISLLIADDERSTRNGISTLIRKSTLPIEIIGIAANGLEALSIANEFAPDILLTDVRMPKMDGIHLAEEVRKICPNCQIIFISGYSDKEYLKSAISLKAISYIEKPIDTTELSSVLSAAISAVQSIQADQLLYLQHQHSLGEKLALELLSPEISETALTQLKEFYPSFYHSDCFCTILCKLNKESNLPFPSEQTILDLLYKNFEQFQISFLPARKESDLFLIHAAFPSGSSSVLLKQSVEELLQQLEMISDIFLCTGSSVSEPKQLYLSYLHAVIGLKRLFFSSYNHVHYFCDKDLMEIKPYRPDNQLIPDFTKALKSGDTAQYTKIIKQHFHSIRKEDCLFNINSIKESYYQLLFTLSSICQERGFNSSLVQETDYLWEVIAKKTTLCELQEYLESRLSLYTAALAAKGNSSQLVQQIYQYIDCHYAEIDLSVNKMADTMHFTAAYLCQIFKAETGQTLNFYINKTRIAKAKELLKDQDCKLQEIARKTGYRDPNHFTKLFKKYENMTPSEFRKKYLL